MTQPINLNKARKARAKTQAKVGAAANRARFGRTKAEKTAASLELQKTSRTLDGAKIEPKS